MNPNEPHNPSQPPERTHQRIIGRVLSTFTETFGLSRTVAVGTVNFIRRCRARGDAFSPGALLQKRILFWSN